LRCRTVLRLVKLRRFPDGKQRFAAAVQALVGARRVEHMTDQLARETVDIVPPKIVNFLAREIENRCAVHNAGADAPVIEYVFAHHASPIDASSKVPGARLLARDPAFRLFLGQTLQEPLPPDGVFFQLEVPFEDSDVFAVDELFQLAQVGGRRS